MRFVLLAFALFGFASPAAADVFRLGEFSFQRQADAGAYELVATIPELLASPEPIDLPQGCAERFRERSADKGLARIAIDISCERPIGVDDRIITRWAIDGAIYVANINGMAVRRALQPENDTIVLPIGETVAPDRTVPEVAREYVWQGIIHILGGWDHLAFVLCLCLLARGRFLLALVTTFTIGHSISLALAFFDVVKVPVLPVEAVIALSIAFMAREAIRERQMAAVDPVRRRRQLAVVGSFGLLHGLGFATVLRELGVAPGERASGLLFFNAGVEVGQLIFVAGVLAVMALARLAGQQQPVRQAALYGAGIVGCFWMIERVAGFTLAVA